MCLLSVQVIDLLRSQNLYHCSKGATDVDAAIDRFISDLTYFSRSQVKVYKSNSGSIRVAQIITSAQRHL